MLLRRRLSRRDHRQRIAALYRGDRIIFGVEDNPLHRIEVTCQSWGCDSCLPRSACGDASAPSPGGRQLVGDPPARDVEDDTRFEWR